MKQSFVLLIPVACFLGLIAFAVLQCVSYRRLKKRDLEQRRILEKERQAREGLRRRIFNHREVPVTLWRLEWNHPSKDANLLGGSVLGGSPGSVIWLEGEQQGLLPGDIVLKWDFNPHPSMARWGYAIERKGRIVAEVLTGLS